MNKRKKTVFGQRLNQARLENAISVRDLAVLAGTQFSCIYQYENYGRIPTIDRAMDLAKTLGKYLDWLCGMDKIEGSNQ